MATYYWVGGSGTWDNTSTTNWSLSSGGANGAGPPLAADDAIFDANSGTAATVTVTGTAAATAVTVNKSDINLNFTGSPTFTNFTLTAGTITLNAQTLTLNNFNSNNSNARTIAFGTGKIVLTGNAAIIWSCTTITNLTVTGTPLVETTYAGGVGTRTLEHGNTAGVTEARAISVTNTAAATDTLAILGGWLNVTLTAFTGTLGNNTRTLYGNWTNGTGQTNTSGNLVMTFAKASGTQTITSAGKQMQPFTVNGSATSVTLADAYTLFTTSTTTCTLTAGTLNLSNQTLTVYSFTLTGITPRTLAFGTGKIILTGNGTTIWSGADLSNFTLTGTPTVETNYAGGTGVRTINHASTLGGTEARAISITPTAAGTDQITAAGHFLNINFTTFAGNVSNSTRTVYGDYTNGASTSPLTGALVMTFAKSSGTQLVTTAGKTMQAFTVNGAATTVRLVDNYTMTAGMTTTTTLTAGTLDLNNNTLTVYSFTHSGTTTRAIAFGTGKIVLTGNGTTIWSGATLTNFTMTGTPLVEANYSGAVGTRTFNQGGTTPGAAASVANGINLSVTAGTDIVAFTTNSHHANLTFTGFSGVLGGGSCRVYGNIVKSATMTENPGTAVFVMNAQSGGPQTITSNGVQGRALTINPAAGVTVQLVDNYTQLSSLTNVMTFTTGTFDLNNNTLTCWGFAASNSNTRTLAFGGVGGITVFGNNGTVWTIATATNLTITGTPNVVFNYAGAVGTRTIFHATTAPTQARSIPLFVDDGVGTAADTLVIQGSFLNFDIRNFVGTLSNSARTIYGNITFTGNFSCTSGANATTIVGNCNFVSNGRVYNTPVVVNGSGITVSASGALNLGTGGLTLTQGTFSTGSFAFTAASISSSGSSVRTLTTTSSIVTITGSGTVLDFSTSTNLTLNNNISFDFSSSSAKTALLGNGTMPGLNQTGSGTLTITGPAGSGFTIPTLTNAYAQSTGPATISFTPGANIVYNLGFFGPSGSASFSSTINSATPGTQVVLRQDEPFYVGASSTNLGNNSGLLFTGFSPNFMTLQDILAADANSADGMFLSF